MPLPTPATSAASVLLRPTTDEPAGSPLWWVDELEHELDVRQILVQLYEDYYEGRHRLAFATSVYDRVFGQMLAAVADNWMPLVVRAAVERMRILSFRLGTGPEADAGTLEMWRRNCLDEDSPLAFTEAAKHGESYLLTWWDQDASAGEDLARITLEHPSQFIVRRRAGDRRRLDAAFKKWQEDDGTLFANLWLPERLYRWRKPSDAAKWEPRELDGIPSDERNPLGEVPATSLVNDPHMVPCLPPNALLAAPHYVPMTAVGLGRSDLADVISTQDQINKLVCDMLIASEVGAFRQRWATGIEVPIDPATGKPVQPFEAAIDRVWIAGVADGAPDAKFGEFSQTDLAIFIGALENRYQSLASRTSTPPHYLLGQSGNFPSGESLKGTETGLVAKVTGKQGAAGGACRRALALGHRVEGNDEKARALLSSGHVAWAPAESRSESEFVDSLLKKLSIGVPPQQLWVDYGYSDQQIAEFRGMLREAARDRGLWDPTAPSFQGLPPEQDTPPAA